MNDGFELLVEKEEMWARMLMQVLEDNDVPCASLPVFGAGFAIKTGAKERVKVYVPAEKLPQAKALLDELFSAESILDETEGAQQETN